MLSGFRSVRHEDVRVATGVTIRLDVALVVGNMSEAITVTAATPALRATREPGTGRLGREGRRAAAQRPQLHHAGLARPGRRAVPPGQPFPRINGGRPRTNEYLFDGISVLQPEPGQVAFFPSRRCDSGIQDRDEQPAGGIRPLQWRRHQPDDQGRDECAARQRFRVLPGRVAERAQLLPDRQRHQAHVQPQSVRRRPRRAADAQSHVLLRGLSGPAAGHRAHRALDGADDGAAAGRLHAEHLRSGDDGVEWRRRLHAHAVPGQHDSHRSHGFGGAVSAPALSGADVGGHREQLPSHRQ